MKMKRWWIACMLALLTLLAAGTALATDGVRQLECETCGTKTLFDRLYYKAEDKLYINGKTGHIGWYQCRECGRMTSNLSDFIAHSGGTATCTERAICEVCGAPYGDYAHVFEPIESKAPTCFERGWKDGKTCINCGYTTRTYIDKRYHAMSISTTQAPTCTEKGWKESHCLYEDCDYVYRTDIPALEHELARTDTQAPTCAEKGWEDYACQREGCNYTTRVYIDTLDHDLEHHDAQAPTCTEGGWDAYDACKNCDYVSEHKEYAALGHNLEHHDAQPPTCTEGGWDAYDACKNCDYVSEHKEYAALGHDLVHHEAKEATCTEGGWDAYDTCKNCDYVSEHKEYAALGHDYESSVVKPTCVRDGYTLHTCTRCGDQYTDAKVGQLHHWYGEWTPDTEGAHHALCLRGCGESAQVACARFAYVMNPADDENAYEFSLCPVCGEVGGGVCLARIEKAAASAVEGVLPAGEAVVRKGTLDNGEAVMSVAFEIAGQPVQPSGLVKITLPAEALTGYTLVLLNADGTEAPLTAETEGETVSFTLDFTDAEAPLMLLRLIPAA